YQSSIAPIPSPTSFNKAKHPRNHELGPLLYGESTKFHIPQIKKKNIPIHVRAPIVRFSASFSSMPGSPERLLASTKTHIPVHLVKKSSVRIDTSFPLSLT